jgi:putative ABC transport system permease protein
VIAGFAGLILRGIGGRRLRSVLLAAAVALVSGIGFLSLATVGTLERTLVAGFERLGADLLVVAQEATVNLTQALLAVEPDAPPLPLSVLEAADRLPASVVVSPQRAIRSGEPLARDLGLDPGSSLPLHGIDPGHDTTVLPWLAERRGIDFQDGQVILGHRVRGRLGDRLPLRGHTYQIYGRLGPTGLPSHEQGLFFTLADLDRLMPSGSAETLGVNGLLLQAPAELPLDQLRFSLLARLEGVRVVGGRTLLAQVRQGGRLILGVLVGSAIGVLVGVLLLLLVTFLGIASERRQEMGLLLSLGATPSQLLTLLVGEASVLCALGGAAGLGLAALARHLLRPLLAQALTVAQLPVQEPGPGQLLRLGLLLWLLLTGLGAVAAALSTSAVLGRDPLILVQDDG